MEGWGRRGRGRGAGEEERDMGEEGGTECTERPSQPIV